jgi:bacterioferritin
LLNEHVGALDRRRFGWWNRTIHCHQEMDMATQVRPRIATEDRENNLDGSPRVSRDELVTLLNDDLAREYQAIVAYVVYSQTLKGAAYMSIAGELEKHASEELSHALIIAKQIDYLGGTPTVTPKPVKTSDQPEAMLQFDLDNENETVRNYRDRVRQCEALGEFAMAEQIRQILVDEQEHQIDLATALGVDVPESSLGRRS